MEIKFNNEVADSVGDSIKERLTTSVYGLFIIFWSVLHWKFLITLFFVSEEKIWKAQHMLKTDYLNGLLWGGTWWWIAILWMTPILFTYLAIRWFPTWFLISAFRKDEQYRTEKTIIKIKEKEKVSKAEKEFEKVEVQKLEVVEEKKEKERSIEKTSPEILWEREYEEFQQDEDLYNKFALIIESIYRHNGNTIKYSNFDIIFQIPTDILAYVHATGLVNIINDQTDIIELTEKGKFFVKQFSLERNLKIVEAKYGKGDKYIDITNELNRLVKNNKLKIMVSNSIAGDPLKGVNKKAVVKYQYNGETKEIIVPEYQVLELPQK